MTSNNSFNNIAHQFYYLKRQLDEQKCPPDIQMSIRPLDKQKCPLDIQKCLCVYWTNRNVHWTFKCPFVQWTSGHGLMANTSVSYPQGVMLDRISSLQLFLHCKSKMSIDIQMPIRPLDKQKCPLTFKCPFVHWTNRNVHWTFKCPFVHWTNGLRLMANTLFSYPHGVMLKVFVQRNFTPTFYGR